MATKNYIPCAECGELADHKLHHDVERSNSYRGPTQEDLHFDECNYEASYESEEDGWVPSVICHEFEEGCYCGERGKCEVCVDQAVENAEYLRDAAKEA
jgi:hypothetical protein